MSRILVEYNPKLSEDSIEQIINNVTPSMTSNDETSNQYEITQVLKILEFYDIEEEDINLVKELIEGGVSFIEF